MSTPTPPQPPVITPVTPPPKPTVGTPSVELQRPQNVTTPTIQSVPSAPVPQRFDGTFPIDTIIYEPVSLPPFPSDILPLITECFRDLLNQSDFELSKNELFYKYHTERLKLLSTASANGVFLMNGELEYSLLELARNERVDLSKLYKQWLDVLDTKVSKVYSIIKNVVEHDLSGALSEVAIVNSKGTIAAAVLKAGALVSKASGDAEAGIAYMGAIERMLTVQSLENEVTVQQAMSQLVAISNSINSAEFQMHTELLRANLQELDTVRQHLQALSLLAITLRTSDAYISSATYQANAEIAAAMAKLDTAEAKAVYSHNQGEAVKADVYSAIIKKAEAEIESDYLRELGTALVGKTENEGFAGLLSVEQEKYRVATEVLEAQLKQIEAEFLKYRGELLRETGQLEEALGIYSMDLGKAEAMIKAVRNQGVAEVSAMGKAEVTKYLEMLKASVDVAIADIRASAAKNVATIEAGTEMVTKLIKEV